MYNLEEPRGMSLNEWMVDSEETVYVRKSAVKLAGDINCGIILSFLDSPIKTYYPYQTKDNILWFEFSRKAVSKELCLTPRQLDLALKKLEEKGLIQKKVFHSVVTHQPTLHVRLMREKYEDGLRSIWRNKNV